MEKQEKIRLSIRIFSHLMKQAINKSFVFPGGGITRKTMYSFIDSVESHYNGELDSERLVDYCICQIYILSMYDDALIKRWTVSHSFGQKAIERFTGNTKGKRYYEDKYLKKNGLSRESLKAVFSNKSKHPLFQFIYPEYEELTKQRMHNSEVGFYICQLSTLLWTPFSVSCRTCNYEERCKSVTEQKYCELYRIRTEEFDKTSKL